MEIVTENPVSLAWIGDAVYSLKARSHILDKGIQKPAVFERASAKICSARGQAAILEELRQRNFFTEDEEEMLRRGRNANVHTTAKNADRKTYMQATALECLIGYLRQYNHPERLEELLDLCMEIGDTL